VLLRSIEPGQYTSIEFTNRLADWKLNGSYGSVGDAFDNAAMEAFWATLKKEVHHIWGPVSQRTRSELRTILFDYIEVFYNRSRHQAGLDDRTPAESYAAHRAA
jgi:transposase InsO family protein